MGVYLPTRYEDVRAVAYDTEHFSSRRVIVRETPPPRIPAPPITSDPPEHRPARMVLLPPFTPDAMKKLEPRARAIANELIDKFAARGSCDAAVEYAQEIPVRVIAHMLGLPEGDGDLYRKWIHEILEVGITDVERRDAGRRRDDAVLHGPRARALREAGRRPHQLSRAAPSSTASR